MGSRSVLDYWMRVASALALVAAVMGWPVQPAKSVACLHRPKCLPRNLTFPGTTHSTSVSATWDPSPPTQVGAIPSENEEESHFARLRTRPQFVNPSENEDEESIGTIAPVCGVFHLPPAAASRPDRILAAFDLDRATYPLRCCAGVRPGLSASPGQSRELCVEPVLTRTFGVVIAVSTVTTHETWPQWVRARDAGLAVWFVSLTGPLTALAMPEAFLEAVWEKAAVRRRQRWPNRPLPPTERGTSSGLP